MSGWLFDTNVLSALAPGRPALSPRTIRWFVDRNEELYFSTITAAEVGAGVAKLRRSGAERRAEALHAWFERVLHHYGDRILPLDLISARIAGELSDAASAIGRQPGFADVAIAATAKAHELIVLTVNRRHFVPLGVDVLDPFVSP